jgi:hypothetical protein
MEYSPDDAARMLGIAPTTLRKWTAEFAPWLTAGAVDPAGRHYSEADMRVLGHAAELLKQRRGYAFARERLAATFGAAERERAVGEVAVEEPAFEADAGAADEWHPREDGGAIEAEVIEPEPQVAPDIAALLERLADLYRELLRNKEQEITALRQALDTAELSAANERRELATLNRLAAIMERENQRLSGELEDAQRRLGELPARSGWRARMTRWLGRSADKTQSAA